MRFTHRSTPFVLLILCILGYGLYLLWMGFYWDDWPWVWFSHVMGSQGMVKIDLEHRPLSGVILWIGSLLAGESPFGWQIYSLIFRFLTGISVWWMLKTLWPDRDEFAISVSLIFLVYPGFSQQFVAVNNSRHILPLALFFLSIGWMAKASRDRDHYWRDTGLALCLSLGGMFISDYYYGLELIRPVILWIINDRWEPGPRLRAVLLDWLPYLIPLTGVFIWRTWVAQQYFYRVSILDDLAAPETSLTGKILDPIEAALGAWVKIFVLPDTAIFGPRMMVLYVAIVIFGMLASFVYLYRFQTDRGKRGWYLKPLVLGLFASILAFIPFWATNLDVKLVFPNDRLTLPMMLGSSFILVSLIYLLVPKRSLRVLLLAIALGLGLGLHLKNANDYRRDWNYQIAFFEQLTWRAPGIAHSTALLANEFSNQSSTDNSLTATLNWIYDPYFSGGDLPVMMFYTTRFGEQGSGLDPETPLQRNYRFYPFNSSMGDSIVLYHAPPACLRILDPEVDLHYPLLPDGVKNFLHFSDPERIFKADPPATLPTHIMGEPLSGTWCYYFEKGDLARQLGDWEQVAKLGDKGFALEDSPNHASERVPFIEGYAHVGEWDKALDLTAEALDINKFMGPMLCDTWGRIDQSTLPSPDKDRAFAAVQTQVNCMP